MRRYEGLKRAARWGEAAWGRCTRKSPFERCDGDAAKDFADCRLQIWLNRRLNGFAFRHCSNPFSALQPPIAFEIVSNDREMNLEFGLGQAQPSHATKMIAALPGPEDFFNSRPDRPQRTIMRFERFGRQPAMALAQKPRRSARGDDGLFDRQRIIGAIGINLSVLPREVEGAIATSASLAGVVSTSRMMPVSLSAAICAL